MRRINWMMVLAMTSGLFTPVSVGGAAAAERLVIAVSPSVRLPVEALARAFEATHPGVTVQLSVTSDPELRQIMAALYHDGRHAAERG
jgi:ABC-type glycerol-3-phosphate transport system substrate-binding protein